MPNPTALTGADLLAKVKEFGTVYKSELVRRCGYVSIKDDGSERINVSAFYEALLNSKGLSIGASATGSGRAGRKLRYAAKVQFNGHLLVGKAYTAQLERKPGDEFEIKLSPKQITLVPLGAVEEVA
jgi:hypothetical protein